MLLINTESKDPSVRATDQRALVLDGSEKQMVLEGKGWKPFDALSKEKKKEVTDSLGLPSTASESEVREANGCLVLKGRGLHQPT